MTMRGSSGCRTAALTAAFGLVGAPASAQALDHLFKSGEEGYRCFRIPAIVATASSTLLVIAEGRKTGGGDAGDIDLVVKRSHDGGETWPELKGDETLVSLVCQANLICYGHQGRTPSLAFSNPASRDSRIRVTDRAPVGRRGEDLDADQPRSRRAVGVLQPRGAAERQSGPPVRGQATEPARGDRRQGAVSRGLREVRLVQPSRPPARLTGHPGCNIPAVRA